MEKLLKWPPKNEQDFDIWKGGASFKWKRQQQAQKPRAHWGCGQRAFSGDLAGEAWRGHFVVLMSLWDAVLSSVGRGVRWKF